MTNPPKVDMPQQFMDASARLQKILEPIHDLTPLMALEVFARHFPDLCVHQACYVLAINHIYAKLHHQGAVSSACCHLTVLSFGKPKRTPMADVMKEAGENMNWNLH